MTQITFMIPWKQFLRVRAYRNVLLVCFTTFALYYWGYGVQSYQDIAHSDPVVRDVRNSSVIENPVPTKNSTAEAEDYYNAMMKRLMTESPINQVTLPKELIDKKVEVLRMKIQELSEKYKEWQEREDLKFAHKFYKHKAPNMTKVSTCDRYSFESKQKKVFLTNIWKSYYNFTEQDVSLVTQISMNKFTALDRLMHHWSGPISIAIYLRQHEFEPAVKYMSKWSLLLNRENIAIHLVAGSGKFYPINFMRNVALNYSLTNYIHLGDVDFTPNFQSHEILKDFLVENAKRYKRKTAFVLPAFEKRGQPHFHYPKSKYDLVHKYINAGKIKTFSAGRFTNGHKPTNTGKWKYKAVPYEVKYHSGYEPYIVIRRDICPRYDQNFMGRYYNKISQLMEVHMAGFDFVVLPNVWTIHYNHKYSPHGSHKKCSINAMRKFRKKLAKRYGGKKKIPIVHYDMIDKLEGKVTEKPELSAGVDMVDTDKEGENESKEENGDNGDNGDEKEDNGENGDTNDEDEEDGEENENGNKAIVVNDETDVDEDEKERKGHR